MDEFLKSRPQRLCKMCGKCCRVATTPLLYEELLDLVKNNDEEAQAFLSIFEPYSSAEEARKIGKETVDNILRNIKKSGKNPDDITFYKCKYITDDNLCGIYQNRLELCERFPTSMLAVVPPGCGFEGFMFQKREELKQKIRKLKEFRLELEVGLKTAQNSEIITRNEEAIKKIDNIIEHYAKYGSKDL